MKRIVMALVVVCFGCRTTEYNIPKDIEGLSKSCLSESKSCIRSTGMKLEDKADKLSVKKIRGTKKFKTGWGWYLPDRNLWVLGLTRKENSRYIIEIGCNPETLDEVNRDALLHEMGHFWLLSNYTDYGHDPKYKGCFWNWNEPPRVACKSNEVIIIDTPNEEGEIK